jgi:hypothetical protein
LSVPQIQPAALEIVGLFGTAILAGIVMLVAIRRQKGAPEGPASWSSDSIGANLAVGAGLVSGLFAVTGLPQLTVYASRPTYGVMIAILAAVVALASPAANLLGKNPRVSLFAAATLVLWGAMGQLIIAFVLVLELQQAAVIAGATVWTLGVLDAVLFIAVLGYVFSAVAGPAAEPRGGNEGAEAPAVARPRGWSIP